MNLPTSQINLNKELEKRDQQIHCLMQITEAINNNATVVELFSIFKDAIHQHYLPKEVSLIIQGEKQWLTYSSQHTKEVSDYLYLLDFYNKNKNKLYTSDQGELYIPVYHKEQLIAIAHFHKIYPKTKEEIKFLKTITNFVAIAIENKRLFKEKRDKEHYKTQLSLAKKIQLSLMPKNLLDTRELEFETLYIPHNEISGDYFDYFHIENSNISLFCIADVAGKGVPAAILMANLQAILRRLSINYTNIATLVKSLNEAVYDITEGDRIVTIFIGAYDVIKNELLYINAGHNYPILSQKNSDIKFLKEGTIPLGVVKNLPEISIGKIKITNDSIILAYTDGLEELRNNQGEMMGYHKILDHLEQNALDDIDIIKDKIAEFIEKFRENEPILDDITVLLCKIRPNAITDNNYDTKER